MNFEQFMEEWKPFPKDKVTRQADKAKKAGDPGRAREMNAVKNYKTRNTDFHKADQKMTGSDHAKHREKARLHAVRAVNQWDKRNKAEAKAIKKGNADDLAKTDPQTKQGKKADKHDRAGNRAYNRGRAMDAVRRSRDRAWKSEDDKQAEINKKSKEDRAKVKKMMNVTKLEKAHKKPAVKGAGKGGFKEHMNFTDYLEERNTISPRQKMGLEKYSEKNAPNMEHQFSLPARKGLIKKKGKKPYYDKVNTQVPKFKITGIDKDNKLKTEPINREKRKAPWNESMNFTDYINSSVSPLYEKEGEVPKCPPGYRFDKEMKMCVPKSPKDAVGNRQKEGDKDLKPGNGAGYNTWGNSGYGGGYAWEEGPTSNDLYNEGRYEDYDEKDKEFKKKDKEMKYGKAGTKSSLRPGEVRKPNSRGGFDSNKED